MNAQTQEIAPANESLPVDPMLSMIERIAGNPDLPMDRIQGLMDMRERQLAKEEEQLFNAAFASAMAEMPDVPRSGHNKHLGTRYSTLDDLIRTTRPVLSRHGLSLSWRREDLGADIKVTAIVRHARGHSIETTLSAKPDSGKQMNHLQGGGSTETYLKRYSGFSILGLSSGDEADDDGQKSGPPISEQQYRDLRDMIEKVGITEEVVCDAAGISMLPDLPADNFNSLKAKLKKTAEARGVEL